MWTNITDKLLLSLGFKRERIWSERQHNFTLKYTIEGYSCPIDLIATFCAPGADSPEYQVENGSDIGYLIENTKDYGYNVYAGKSHIVTIHLEAELLMLMSALKIDKEY